MDWVWFKELSVSLLVGISGLLSITEIPVGKNSDWKTTQVWKFDGQGHVYEAESDRVVRLCIENPRLFIEFPNVIHGVHEVYRDGTLIPWSGPVDFKVVRAVYSPFIVSCRSILQHQAPGGQKFPKVNSILTWKVYSMTRFFSRVSTFPTLVESDYQAYFIPKRST